VQCSANLSDLLSGIGSWISTIWGILAMMGIAQLIPYMMGVGIMVGFAFAIYHKLAG